MLDGHQKQHWRTFGWLAIDDLLAPDTVAELKNWVDEVGAPLRAESEKRLHYYEQTKQGPALCRTERYCDDHAGMRELINNGRLSQVATELLEEPALLYKEKINYKPPGGAGFVPHQDATAYPLVRRIVTCLVAVDAMTADNGCLEFASGSFGDVLAQDGDGCLAKDVSDGLAWQRVEVAPGGVVFFTSYVPHRSGSNRSPHSRRRAHKN